MKKPDQIYRDACIKTLHWVLKNKPNDKEILFLIAELSGKNKESENEDILLMYSLN